MEIHAVIVVLIVLTSLISESLILRDGIFNLLILRVQNFLTKHFRKQKIKNQISFLHWFFNYARYSILIFGWNIS